MPRPMFDSGQFVPSCELPSIRKDQAGFWSGSIGSFSLGNQPNIHPPKRLPQPHSTSQHPCTSADGYRVKSRLKMEGSTIDGLISCKAEPILMNLFLTVRVPLEKTLSLDKIEVSTRSPSRISSDSFILLGVSGDLE